MALVIKCIYYLACIAIGLTLLCITDYEDLTEEEDGMELIKVIAGVVLLTAGFALLTIQVTLL